MEKKGLNNLIAFDFKMICNLERVLYNKIFVESNVKDVILIASVLKILKSKRII